MSKCTLRLANKRIHIKLVSTGQRGKHAQYWFSIDFNWLNFWQTSSINWFFCRSLRTKQQPKILINLCFSLLLLYLVFLFGVEIDAEIPCIVVAVLLHYFILTSVAWMGVEAVNMYILSVKVVGAHISKFLWKASVLAWGKLKCGRNICIYYCKQPISFNTTRKM